MKKIILMSTTALIFLECLPVSAQRFPHGAGQCKGYENLARSYRDSASASETGAAFYGLGSAIPAAKLGADLMNNNAKRSDENARRVDQLAKECWAEVGSQQPQQQKPQNLQRDADLRSKPTGSGYGGGF